MTDKIALGITIAVAVAFVFIIIAIVVVIIKNKKKPDEETKEGFKTGKETVPNLLINTYLNSALTKDGNSLNSSVKTMTVTAIQRAINKARKELDTAVETFKKRCEEKGIPDHKKATGIKKTFVTLEKTTVTSKFNMVVNLYKLLGDVTSKFKHGIKIVTEIAVPEVDMSINTTSTINSNTHLTIEEAVKSYIFLNCNYMEVPTYKYVQASFGRQRMNNGKEVMEWHESSYKAQEAKANKLEEAKLAKPIVMAEEVKPIIVAGVVEKDESVDSNGNRIAKSKSAVQDVKFTGTSGTNVAPVNSKSVAQAIDFSGNSASNTIIKPVKSNSITQDVKFTGNSTSNGPIVIDQKARSQTYDFTTNNQSIVDSIKNEEVVVSNYVEPVRVADTQSASVLKTDSNIIAEKIENPKAEAVQASVVNNYVKSKAEEICTTDEQEIKFLKALRSLK